MAVLDWLLQLLGGGDPEAAGAAQASAAMQPATQPFVNLGRDLTNTLAVQPVTDAFGVFDRVLSGQGFTPEEALNVAALPVGGSAFGGGGGGLGAGIRAWHASPYDFDKFDISKVGTGQGAASYGHGIYAAENPRVSGPGGSYDLEFTAKNLGKYDLNQGEQEVLRVLRAGGTDMDALGSLARGGGYTFEQAHDVLNRVKAAKAKLYEVDINADPNTLVNFDKPAVEQSDLVRQALERAGANPSLLTSNRAPVGEYIRRAGENPLYAADLFNKGVGELSLTPADVSARLREAGIPGSQYLDQASRNAGGWRITPPDQTVSGKWMVKSNDYNSKGMHFDTEAEAQAALQGKLGKQTSNYVMFDDKLMSIYRKLGLLPPLAAGGLLAAQPGESAP